MPNCVKNWEGKVHQTMLLRLFIVCFSLLGFFSHAEEAKVALFYGQKATYWKIEVTSGFLVLYDAEEHFLSDFAQGTTIHIKKTEQGIHVFTDLKDFGTAHRFRFKAAMDDCFYEVYTVPGNKKRLLHDDLEVRKHTKAPLVTSIKVQDYLPGVLLAESGIKQGVEYYKVQSIICRTFLYSNWNKHQDEGFNVCDKVHCQVFYGMEQEHVKINAGVKETEDLVLVDSSLNMIETVFHANCGGQTLNSEDYWQSPVSYLRSVKDEHCHGGKHGHWEVSLNEKEWLGYLKNRFGYPVHDSTARKNALNYPAVRGKYLFHPRHKIPLRSIRKNWKLKSTFFELRHSSDGKVRFLGKGYGHGVGLCQEGAMQKAKTGWTFTDILHHYFQYVFLVEKSKITDYRTGDF